MFNDSKLHRRDQNSYQATYIYIYINISTWILLFASEKRRRACCCVCARWWNRLSASIAALVALKRQRTGCQVGIISSCLPGEKTFSILPKMMFTYDVSPDPHNALKRKQDIITKHRLYISLCTLTITPTLLYVLLAQTADKTFEAKNCTGCRAIE